jgi:hypothetical protein
VIPAKKYTRFCFHKNPIDSTYLKASLSKDCGAFFIPKIKLKIIYPFPYLGGKKNNSSAQKFGGFMLTVSNKLKIALKLNPKPAYQIAWAADINPNVLSKLINGIERVQPNDQRIIAVGKVLGVPEEECFQEESH